MLKIRDLKGMENVSPEWSDKFEAFIPIWLESLVPHYKVAKEYGADMLELVNTMYLTNYPDDLIVNGVHYYLVERPGIGKILSFNSNFQYYPVNWKERFKEYAGDVDNLSDWLFYHTHTTRYMNREAPYNELRIRIERLFREITGDDSVGFDFGSTSYILLNPEMRWYIKSYKSLES